jgi:hypothetical protein
MINPNCEVSIPFLSPFPFQSFERTKVYQGVYLKDVDMRDGWGCVILSYPILSGNLVIIVKVMI